MDSNAQPDPKRPTVCQTPGISKSPQASGNDGKSWAPMAASQTRDLFVCTPDSKLNHTTCLNSVHPKKGENIHHFMEHSPCEPVERRAELHVLLPGDSVR